jgi:hypothetical protein
MVALHDIDIIAVKDCSTWFLVVFKPKKTYPLPPRFSAHAVL